MHGQEPSAWEKFKMGAMMGVSHFFRDLPKLVLTFIDNSWCCDWPSFRYVNPSDISIITCTNFLKGSVAVFQQGPGPNGIVRSIGQYMMTSGATFGLFMSIGSSK